MFEEEQRMHLPYVYHRQTAPIALMGEGTVFTFISFHPVLLYIFQEEQADPPEKSLSAGGTQGPRELPF